MKKTLLIGALSVLLNAFTQITPLLGQEKGICPELAKFSLALTKHQQVQIKDMLKTSGLMDAVGLSKQDQEDLVIEYDEQRHSSGATQPIAFSSSSDIYLQAPKLTIGGKEAKDLKTVFTPEQLWQWMVKYAAALSHEMSHLVTHDSACSTSIGNNIVEYFQPLPLSDDGYFIQPYTLSFYPSFQDYAQDLIDSPSDTKLDQKHFVAAKPLPLLQSTLLQKSPEHPQRLEILHGAAKKYAELYKTTQLTEEFWKKSQATQHISHPKSCLKELSSTLMKMLQQATWFSQFDELQADKNAIESILKLQISPSLKNNMLLSRYSKFYERRNSNKHDIPTNIICSHPPYLLREYMLEVGATMLKYGQRPELTRKLNELAIPSYLKIPKEPKRTPIIQP